MNKTILLACCDFLILATLSMLYFNKADTPKTPDTPLVHSSDFTLTDDTNKNEIEEMQALQELKTIKAEETLKAAQIEKNQLKLELQEQINLNTSKDTEINSLKKLLKSASFSIHEAIAASRWQVSVAMKEDDSISPDLFKTHFFSCAIRKGDQAFIPANFQLLGFNWNEIQNDGHINALSITLGRTGANPWSGYVKKDILSFQQEPSCCLLEVPVGRAVNAIAILDKKELQKNLSNLYAAKTDGRLIKILNASILPDSPQWLDINEERYLGHPDKVEAGDLIVTAQGKGVGLITREQRDSNRTRLRAHIFDYLSFDDCFNIPVSKANNEIYYSKFVSSVKEIYRDIKR